MRKFFLLIALVFSAAVSAQDIDFKKGQVLIDGNPCLKYESDPNNVTYSTLDGTEIVILKFIRVHGILYNKVVFLESGEEFTSQNYIYTKKLLVEKLLKSNTLVDCKLVPEKVKTFCIKNDEKVEERFRD